LSRGESNGAKKGRDWYKVSVDTLRGWGFFFVLVALAGTGYFGVQYLERQGLRDEAARVLDEDGVLFQQLRGDSGGAQFQLEYEAAWADLQTARQHFAEKQYRGALDIGRRCRDVLLSIRDASRRQDETGEAQFIAVQGRVEYRRGESGDWRTARTRETLNSGDYVKTADGGSAEVMFVDGTLYTVRPNTLFLVSKSSDDSRGEQAITLEYGWVNLNTARNASRVATPDSQARVEDDSQAVVSYDEADKSANFTAYRGAVEVRSGGETRRITALQTVQKVGSELSETQDLPPAPLLLSPSENQNLDIDSTRELLLSWQPVRGADRYALQISRNRLFVNNVIDVENRKTVEATLGLRGEGSFFWRTSAIGASGLQGPWSSPSRFRVASLRSRDDEVDQLPPEVSLDEVQAYGSIFIVRGSTEAGASVRVNGDPVVVEADGTFTKTIQLVQTGWDFIEARATDASGNEARARRRVYVYGL
jgi:hypothetical protein